MAAKNEISIQVYSEILKSIELESICLIEANFKVDKEKINGQVKLEVKEAPKFELKDGHFTVVYKTTLRGMNEESNEVVLNIGTIHELSFKSTLEAEIPKTFFDKFGVATVPLAIWPYFREYAQNMISRTQLPLLTLPLKKAI